MERTPEEESERARIRRERDLLKNPDMERDVPRILRLRRDAIAAAKARHGVTERITTKQANRWMHDQDPIPEWLQELFDRKKARNAARNAARRAKAAKVAKEEAEYRQAVEDAYDTVADALVAGKRRFSGPEEDAANDMAFRALKEFIKDRGDTAGLDALDRAALKYAGVDPDNPRTWPEGI